MAKRRRKRGNHPYVDMRQQDDGSVRPRFKPDDSARALGYRSFDLTHDDDGRWFTFEEACVWAQLKRTEIRNARGAGARPKAPPSPRGRTVFDLLEDFLKSGRFNRPRAEKGYAVRSKGDYRTKADAIIYRLQSDDDRRAGKPRELEDIARAPATSIKPGRLYNDEKGGLFAHLRDTRGLSMARGAIMVLSAAYKWGAKAEGWGEVLKQYNPCLRLGLPKAKGKAQELPADLIRTFIAWADHPAIGEIELADFVFLTIYSGGQRECDAIDFSAAHEVDAVHVVNGKRVTIQAIAFTQSKRERQVQVMKLPRLVERLEQMQKRREENNWTADALVIDSHTGSGFNQSTLQKRVRKLRKRIVAGAPELGLAPCPAMAAFTVKALRSTVLTWIKRAGCGDHQFVSVSGHSLKSLPQVLPHYYTPGAEEARQAMDLLWLYLEERDMAV